MNWMLEVLIGFAVVVWLFMKDRRLVEMDSSFINVLQDIHSELERSNFLKYGKVEK